jgi:hypothetical protein
MSGLEVGFNVKQVLWLLRIFERKGHTNWDGRIL